jgi:hypothetical protein
MLEMLRKSAVFEVVVAAIARSRYQDALESCRQVVIAGMGLLR